MTSQQKDKCKLAFMRYCVRNKMDINLARDGEFDDLDTLAGWKAWQAAWEYCGGKAEPFTQ